MITRTHSDERAESVATFSECEAYRYTLTRRWGEGPGVMFLMLNPSTADEFKNDPTVERCERRARGLGYGAFRVCNIFAFRATDPKVMRAAADPIGPHNDAAILDGCAWADAVVAAWGTHGAHLGRGPEVQAMLVRAGVTPLALGLSKDGHPKHPLYISYAVQPQPWPLA
ncbi:MAG: DUF1643 domain-containing protein [Pseudomonadota bacterium]